MLSPLYRVALITALFREKRVQDQRPLFFFLRRSYSQKQREVRTRKILKAKNIQRYSINIIYSHFCNLDYITVCSIKRKRILQSNSDFKIPITAIRNKYRLYI